MISLPLVRRTWRRVEPLHGMIYFVPEAGEHYARLGLDHFRMQYFASRAAPMGPVSAEVVIATFFNFEPSLVRRSIPAAWERAEPSAISTARLAAVDAALRRMLGNAVGSDEMREASELARTAALAATTRPEGRPLFAGHAALPWPDEPHLVLWHAQTLLREFRGDGHVGALLLEGFSGVEALVVHAATGEVPAEALQTTRAWSDDAWEAAVGSLRSRGFIETEELTLTDEGRGHRDWVEQRTDELMRPAYEAIGTDGCDRLGEIARHYSRTIIERSGLSVGIPSRAKFERDG